MSEAKLIKLLAKLEKQFENTKPACKVTRNRILKKAESVQKRLDNIS